MSGNLIIEKALCDWIRVTSFRPIHNYEHGKDPDNRRLVKRRQYTGYMWDGIFHGRGMQKAQSHWMSEATGDRARTAYTGFGEDLKCTRIDLQVTLPMTWDTMRAAELQLGKARWRHKARQLELRKHTNREDTLYIGARKDSPLYIRIYSKGNAGSEMCRFEVEFKEQWAPSVWAAIHDGVTLEELLAQQIWAIPQVEALRPFHAWASRWEHFKAEPTKKMKSKRGWVEATCIPALWKAANEHGDKDWLLDALNEIVVFLQQDT